MYLDNTWNPNLSVTGADGLPPINMAGNAVRSSTSVKLSMRLPPVMDPNEAYEAIEKKLTFDIPYRRLLILSRSLIIIRQYQVKAQHTNIGDALAYR
jgi:hypothetical protein